MIYLEFYFIFMFTILSVIVVSIVFITRHNKSSFVLDENVDVAQSNYTLSDEANKNAIVILTRGYNELQKYNLLVQRNKSLENFYDKTIDCLIFHEGNISKKQQQIIQFYSGIQLHFIDVSKSFNYEWNKFDPMTKSFGLGYRNMCNFWFCEFWNYVNKYDKMLRIDEDCIWKNGNDYKKCFEELEKYDLISGMVSGDKHFVTKGMNKFTMEFIQKQESMKEFKSKKPSGPYTNVFGLNLKNVRKNDILFEYITHIKNSNNIYIYRWGDLPLWGEAVEYFMDKNKVSMKNKNISYYHSSHNQAVN